MLAVDRRHRILQQVAERQTIHIAELAAELDVSEMTIRRDITRLERDGFLRRTYGGATAHITRSMELLFNARALENAPAKRLIGMQAAPLLERANSVFVGMGSTTEQVAMFLSPRDDLTIITSSVTVASFLGTRRGRIIILGGSVLTDELACVGPIAEATARRYHADITVIGAAGLSADRGLTELDDAVAEVNRLMIEQSDRVIVVADGSKIDASAMAAVAPAHVIHTLVTDSDAPRAALDDLRALGMEIVVVARGQAPGAGTDGSGRAPVSPPPEPPEEP
jgi:DeoR family transcriptional regulator, fructose operon transcriptional repressor